MTLRDFLKREHVTQAGFARWINVSTPTVCQWVAGVRRPRLDHAMLIETFTRGMVPAKGWVKKRGGGR